MEGMSVLGCCDISSSKFQLNFYSNICLSLSFPSLNRSRMWNPKPNSRHQIQKASTKLQNKGRLSVSGPCLINQNLTLTATLMENETDHSLTATGEEDDNEAAYRLPRIDKSGRFCSPRAARELALLITYASCLQGSDPVRLFDSQLNFRAELDKEFDRSTLLKYDHMSYAGSSVIAPTMEEAEQLLTQFEKESAIEEAVLSAPPKLVYGKLILRFTRKLLSAVVDRWDSHVLVIDKVAPLNWKIEPSGRILEFSILHLAMSEISVLGTKKQIVINEAVDLAKRFCDGTAPRIINGCLRTFVQNLS